MKPLQLMNSRYIRQPLSMTKHIDSFYAITDGGVGRESHSIKSFPVNGSIYGDACGKGSSNLPRERQRDWLKTTNLISQKRKIGMQISPCLCNSVYNGYVEVVQFQLLGRYAGLVSVVSMSAFQAEGASSSLVSCSI